MVSKVICVPPSWHHVARLGGRSEQEEVVGQYRKMDSSRKPGGGGHGFCGVSYSLLSPMSSAEQSGSGRGHDPPISFLLDALYLASTLKLGSLALLNIL